MPEQLLHASLSSQGSLVPGVHTAQTPAVHWQLVLQASVSVPGSPSASLQETERVLPAAQAPWPVQALHWQLVLHVEVPQFPQLCVEPAAHAPCPVQVPDSHWHDALQLSVRWPQLPQAATRVLPGAHAP